MNGKGLAYNITTEEMEWLQRSYLGHIHKLQATMITQDKLHREGIFNITAAPLGGNLVLLTPKGNEDVLAILKEPEP